MTGAASADNQRHYGQGGDVFASLSDENRHFQGDCRDGSHCAGRMGKRPLP